MACPAVQSWAAVPISCWSRQRSRKRSSATVVRHISRRDPANVRSSDTVQEAFAGIIDLLAAKTPHDFSFYKQGTLQRRIARRMAMAGIESGAQLLAGPARGFR